MLGLFSIPWLFSVLALASMAQSQQLLIDDTDTSVLKYSENPNGAKWGPFANGGEQLSLTLANGSMMAIDATPCYNHTYTYAACTTDNNCQLEIPFNGSGITIYVYQAGAQGINASFQVDNSAPAVNSLNAPPGPTFEVANVSIYDVQSLPSGNHTLTLTVLDWAGIFSGMMFDYAAVNQTFVAPPPTTSSSASTSATSSAAPTGTTISPATSKSSTNIGAVVGGVVAGVAVIAALIFAILYFRRRNRRPATSDVRHSVTPFDAIPFTSTPFDPTSSISNNTIARTASIPFADNPSASTPFLSSTSPPSSPPSSKFAQNMALVNPSVSILAPSGPRTTSETSYPPSPPRPSHELASSPSAMRENLSLTDEQADFVHSLYNNNVPAPAIARVMERMIADRGSHNRAASSTRLTDDFAPHDSMPPPGYYDAPS